MPIDPNDRRNFIGGSDAAAVVGKSRWTTPLQLYLEKRGEAEPKPFDPDIGFWGNADEPALVRWFCERNRAEVVELKPKIANPKFPWAGGEIDAIVRLPGGKLAILDAKTVGPFAGDKWGAPESDEVPVEYIFQLQHYAIVAEIWELRIAARMSVHAAEQFVIPGDRDFGERLMAREAEFMRAVKNGTPPDPLEVEADARLRWPRGNGKAVEATPEIAATCSKLYEVNQLRIASEAEEKSLRGVVQSFMGDNSTLTFQGRTLATWSNNREFDAQAFIRENPELAKKHLKQSVDRAALDREFPSLVEKYKTIGSTRAFKIKAPSSKGSK